MPPCLKEGDQKQRFWWRISVSKLPHTITYIDKQITPKTEWAEATFPTLKEQLKTLKTFVYQGILGSIIEHRMLQKAHTTNENL